MVGKAFIPTKKFNDEKAKTAAQVQAYNELKDEFEQFKQSKMTDDEKKKAAEQAKEEQYKQANLTISKMYAENTFAKAGIDEADYKDILDQIVTEDAEKTKGLAQTIVNAISKNKIEIEKKVKDSIVNNTTTPPAGNGDNFGTSKLDQYKNSYNEAVKKNDFMKMAYYTRLIQEEQRKNN